MKKTWNATSEDLNSTLRCTFNLYLNMRAMNVEQEWSSLVLRKLQHFKEIAFLSRKPLLGKLWPLIIRLWLEGEQIKVNTLMKFDECPPRSSWPAKQELTRTCCSMNQTNRSHTLMDSWGESRCKKLQEKTGFSFVFQSRGICAERRIQPII